MSNPIQPRYFGWKLAYALLVMLTFTSGLSFYNHAVILNALARQPAFTVQSASFAVTLFFLTSGLTGLWVAKLLDRFDPRICIIFGAVASALALTALAWVGTIWQLYLVYILFGVGFSASSLLPATTLITRWFRQKRAVALSIASTGLSLGGVVITPICATLVETIGLAHAGPIMGLMYLVGVIPVAWIWIRPSPQSIGSNIDGIALAPESTQHSQHSQHNAIALEGISFRQARTGKFFWCISFSYIFLMIAQVGGIAHQYGLAKETLSDAQTVLALMILPIASIVGRLIGGWVIGQMSIRTFALAMMVLQVLALLLLTSGHSVFTLCFGLACFGVTVGNILMLQPLLIAEAYGVREYPRIFSMSGLLSSMGTAAGPVLLGAAYQFANSHYSLAYAVAAVAGLIGLILFALGGSVKQYLRT